MAFMLPYESISNPCSVCASVDLDDAFDPRQFDGLPPLRASGATPWTKYLRKILTFTADAVQASPGTCGLCRFLRIVSATAEKFKVPSIGSSGLEFPPPPNTSMDDGDGFTLAATSSHFIYPVSGSNNDPDGPYPPEVAAVWLIVIKGSNTLERLIHEYQQPQTRCSASRLPLNLIRDISSFVRNTGTWIAAADTSDLTHPPPSIRGRLITPGRLDYNLMKSWLNSCTAHQFCHPPVSIYIPHMKLIDCQTRTIVPATPSMPYLALSYVWGTGAPEKYNYPHLPTPLLQTVQDAIRVTLQLGFRYIWIDRYCIWQDDLAHKMSQILAMRDIYGHAVATIAASSGPDPTYGLPGVSDRRSRAPYQQIIGNAGHRVLVSGAVQRRQEEAVSQSVWETRAWTFQEAALSPRIFYFTDAEVSFSCAEAQGFEHLSHLLDVVSPDGTRTISKYGVREPEGVVTLVRRYSARKMTYSSDALNACVGALSRWVELNDKCFHYWGCPIAFRDDDKETMLGESLWIGLCWRLDSGAVKAGARRDGFPSWSWLAVEGRIQCNGKWDPQALRERSGGGFEFAVEEGGKMVEWGGFAKRGGLLKSPLDWGTKLRVQGWVFDVGPFVGVAYTRPRQTIYYAKWTDEATKKARVLKFLPDFGMAAPARFLFEKFEAVATYAYNYQEVDFAIVFERAGDAVKRIGLLQLAEREVAEGDIPTVERDGPVDARTLGARWDSVCLS
ncbi:hypothetical protein OQA88_11310 [Cercophora sp. LCS_1]